MVECVVIPMMVLFKDFHGGILMMYSSIEKMRGIACNHGGVIILWVKRKPMFEKPARRWRESIVVDFCLVLPSLKFLIPKIMELLC